jgi:hypothetical protein
MLKQPKQLKKSVSKLIIFKIHSLWNIIKSLWYYIASVFDQVITQEMGAIWVEINFEAGAILYLARGRVFRDVSRRDIVIAPLP